MMEIKQEERELVFTAFPAETVSSITVLKVKFVFHFISVVIIKQRKNTHKN